MIGPIPRSSVYTYKVEGNGVVDEEGANEDKSRVKNNKWRS